MDTTIFSILYQRLKSRQNSVLIRIIHREGSTPRGVGAVCLADEHGLAAGTIGGGLLEYRAVEKAKVVLQQAVTSLSSVEMNSREVEEEGMICGGRIELFFEPVFAGDKRAFEFFAAVDKLIGTGGRGVLVTLLRDGCRAGDAGTRMLVSEDQNTIGAIPGVPAVRQVAYPERLKATENTPELFVEPVRRQPELILFGGGHVSTFIAPLARMVGFRVRVVDDRSEFANRERFTDADDIHVMSYSETFKRIEITRESYLVIVTRGHSMDREVLEMALNLEFSPAYIGMIGSVRKRDIIYQALFDDGMDSELLARVHSPIGLEIGAQTPEEIAVSIIAEIIQVRAGNTAGTVSSPGKKRFLPL